MTVSSQDNHTPMRRPKRVRRSSSSACRGAASPRVVKRRLLHNPIKERPLDDFVRNDPSFTQLTPPERNELLVDLFVDVSNDLTVAHRRGLFHGDLKMNNVLCRYEHGRIAYSIDGWSKTPPPQQECAASSLDPVPRFLWMNLLHAQCEDKTVSTVWCPGPYLDRTGLWLMRHTVLHLDPALPSDTSREKLQRVHRWFAKPIMGYVKVVQGEWLVVDRVTLDPAIRCRVGMSVRINRMDAECVAVDERTMRFHVTVEARRQETCNEVQEIVEFLN